MANHTKQAQPAKLKVDSDVRQPEESALMQSGQTFEPSMLRDPEPDQVVRSTSPKCNRHVPDFAKSGSDLSSLSESEMSFKSENEISLGFEREMASKPERKMRSKPEKETTFKPKKEMAFKPETFATSPSLSVTSLLIQFLATIRPLSSLQKTIPPLGHTNKLNAASTEKGTSGESSSTFVLSSEPPAFTPSGKFYLDDDDVRLMTSVFKSLIHNQDNLHLMASFFHSAHSSTGIYICTMSVPLMTDC